MGNGHATPTALPTTSTSTQQPKCAPGTRATAGVEPARGTTHTTKMQIKHEKVQRRDVRGCADPACAPTTRDAHFSPTAHDTPPCSAPVTSSGSAATHKTRDRDAVITHRVGIAAVVLERLLGIDGPQAGHDQRQRKGAQPEQRRQHHRRLCVPAALEVRHRTVYLNHTVRSIERHGEAQPDTRWRAVVAGRANSGERGDRPTCRQPLATAADRRATTAAAAVLTPSPTLLTSSSHTTISRRTRWLRSVDTAVVKHGRRGGGAAWQGCDPLGRYGACARARTALPLANSTPRGNEPSVYINNRNRRQMRAQGLAQRTHNRPPHVADLKWLKWFVQCGRHSCLSLSKTAALPSNDDGRGLCSP